MADSPRWCETCQAWGDHHTDRHDLAGALQESLERALERSPILPLMSSSERES